jgi:hypothetical protein
MKTMIVTKQSLLTMLQTSRERQAQVVGRALVALFLRQTEDEKDANKTNHDNDVGFQHSDAKRGSITAKYFLKHGTLLDWQVEPWLAPQGNKGYPRIAKYSRQLNEIALAKRKG